MVLTGRTPCLPDNLFKTPEKHVQRRQQFPRLQPLHFCGEAHHICKQDRGSGIVPSRGFSRRFLGFCLRWFGLLGLMLAFDHRHDLICEQSQALDLLVLQGFWSSIHHTKCSQ